MEETTITVDKEAKDLFDNDKLQRSAKLRKRVTSSENLKLLVKKGGVKQ